MYRTATPCTQRLFSGLQNKNKRFFSTTTPKTFSTALSTPKWSQLETSQKISYITGSLATAGCLATLASPSTKQTFEQIENHYQALKTTTTPDLPTTSYNPASIMTSSPILASTHDSTSFTEPPPTTHHIPFSLLDQANAATFTNNTRFVVDGKVYPGYTHYMASEGFIFGHRDFASAAPKALAVSFAVVPIIYQASQNLMSPHKAGKVESWLINNMTLSYDNRFKPWTYLTNSLTHFTPLHTGANIMAMLSFAPSVGVLSPQAFFTLFGGLALTSSLLSLALTTGLARTLLRFGRQPSPSLMNPAVGASGVIAAMVSISALTNPSSEVSIFGITPSFNIITGLGCFMLLDFIGLIAQCAGKSTSLSHAGHISGYLCGLGLFALAKSKFESKYQRGTYKHYGNWLEHTLMPWLNGNPAVKRNI